MEIVNNGKGPQGFRLGDKNKLVLLQPGPNEVSDADFRELEKDKFFREFAKSGVVSYVAPAPVKTAGPAKKKAGRPPKKKVDTEKAD